MKRRWLSIMLCIVLVGALLPAEPAYADYEDGVECEFCGTYIWDDWKCDGGDHCALGYGCGDEHHCASCDTCDEGDNLCDECDHTCIDCLKEMDLHCQDCGAHLEEGNHCTGCYKCFECTDKCLNDCDTLCLTCHLENEQACENCGACFIDGNYQPCQSCHEKCANCADEWCEECAMCVECAIETSNHCPECGGCFQDLGSPACSVCGLCENCAGDICEECEMCVDCAIEQHLHCVECEEHFDGYFCQLCYKCLVCGGICADDCEDICAECHLENDLECEQCGACFIEDKHIRCQNCLDVCEVCAEDWCEDCHMCGECAMDTGNHCQLCGKCLVGGSAGTDFCGACFTCSDCATICAEGDGCSMCAVVCENCGFCENCSIVCPNGDHCENCGFVCENCGYCDDCAILCEANHDGCSECSIICENCTLCENCTTICPNGDGCAECATLCETCDYCENCADICVDGDHCSECGNICENCGYCDSCATVCVNGDYCSECALICEDCGFCAECADVCPNGDHCSECSMICENCGYCENCADICLNGDACSECSNICSYCELCEDCCIALAEEYGCEHGICIYDPDFEDHWASEHEEQNHICIADHDYEQTDEEGHRSICAICGEIMEDSYEDHSFGEWTGDIRICEDCGYEQSCDWHTHTKGDCVSLDNGKHSVVCTVCDYPMEPEDCTISSIWVDNGHGYHEKLCTECGYVMDTEDHYDADADGICDICTHTHSYVYRALPPEPNRPARHEGVCACGARVEGKCNRHMGPIYSLGVQHCVECELCGRVADSKYHIDDDGDLCCDVCPQDLDGIYTMTEGAGRYWDKTSTSSVRFASDAPLKYFDKLVVDGEEVADTYYETKYGPTAVVIKPAFMSTLSVGAHDMTIVSTNGTAKGTFTVTDGCPLGHSGGTATCCELAVCVHCGQPYGSLADHVYKTTYEYDDTMHYRECLTCGAAHIDEGLHTIENGRCTVCNYKNNYTVTFVMNGYGTAPAEQTVIAGSRAEKPEDPTAMEYGKEFVGWFKDADGLYRFNFSNAITADTTIYAVWCDCTHKNIEKRGAKLPTCETEGYTGDFYCLACGEKVGDGSVILAIGHNYENNTCIHCGDSLDPIVGTGNSGSADSPSGIIPEKPVASEQPAISEPAVGSVTFTSEAPVTTGSEPASTSSESGNVSNAETAAETGNATENGTASDVQIVQDTVPSVGATALPNDNSVAASTTMHSKDTEDLDSSGVAKSNLAIEVLPDTPEKSINNVLLWSILSVVGIGGVAGVGISLIKKKHKE